MQSYKDLFIYLCAKVPFRCSNLILFLLLLLLSQLCPSLCDPIDGRQPTRLPCPWDSPGKNTGVGCHFLLQCMKVQGESEVAQSCLTLSDPMDCSLPGSSVHGIFQARVLEWGVIAFSRSFSQFHLFICLKSYFIKYDNADETEKKGKRKPLGLVLVVISPTEYF